MSDEVAKSWRRVGGIPAFVALVVGIAIGVAQVESVGIFGCSLGRAWGRMDTNVYARGWPLCCVRCTEHTTTMHPIGSQTAVALVAGPPDSTEYEWRLGAAGVDVLVACLLVASTFCVCEHWRRCRWQFGMRALMAIVSVAAFVTLIAQHEVEIVAMMGNLAPTFASSRRAHSWLVAAPLILGAGCAILVVGYLALAGIRRAGKRFSGEAT